MRSIKQGDIQKTERGVEARGPPPSEIINYQSRVSKEAASKLKKKELASWNRIMENLGDRAEGFGFLLGTWEALKHSEQRNGMLRVGFVSRHLRLLWGELTLPEGSQ